MKGNLQDLRSALLNALESRKPSISVTVMPDFFLDRLVRLTFGSKKFLSRIKQSSKIQLPLRSRQTATSGGNATNLAGALAQLGITVNLIVNTSREGYCYLTENLNSRRIDFSGVKTDGELCMTTSIEIPKKGDLMKVMLSNPESRLQFGPEKLTDGDIEKIRTSDYVSVLNWGANRMGTELAARVFSIVKEEGRGKTFLDTSDPSLKMHEVKRLMREVVQEGLVDIFSVNEEESILYASYFSKKNKIAGPKIGLHSAKLIHLQTGIRIDFHSARISATFIDGAMYSVPTVRVKARRATGAGDVWNAGDIYGDAVGLEPKMRLHLANVTAALFISSSDPRPPTLSDIIEFLRSEHRFIH